MLLPDGLLVDPAPRPPPKPSSNRSALAEIKGSHLPAQLTLAGFYGNRKTPFRNKRGRPDFKAFVCCFLISSARAAANGRSNQTRPQQSALS